MSLLCIGGICIPYSIFWPFLMLLAKYIYEVIIGGSKKANAHHVRDMPLKAATYSGVLAEENNFKSIIASDSKTIVKFTSDWCTPCKALEPVWKDYLSLAPSMSLVSVDVDKFDSIAAEYSVFSIPRFIVFKQGQVVATLANVKDEAVVREFLHTHTQK